MSNNNLFGVIPPSLEALLNLENLNLSLNKLQGKIPVGGPFRNFLAESLWALRGSSPLQVPPCKTSAHRNSRRSTILLLIILPFNTLVVLVLVLMLVWVRCRNRRTKLPNEDAMLPQETRRRVFFIMNLYKQRWIWRAQPTRPRDFWFSLCWNTSGWIGGRNKGVSLAP